MRWPRFGVLVVVVSLLQAGFVAALNIKPDLLLILLVFLAIYCNTTEAIVSSFTIGFAADLIGQAMGPQMISFGLFGTLLAYLSHVVTIKKMPYQAIAIFVATWATGALAHLLAFLVKAEPLTTKVYTSLLTVSIYSAVVGPFLFLPMAWWMRIRMDRLGRR